jgi:hypothetical protein
MRDVPWFDRDRHSLSAAIHANCGAARSASIVHAFDSMYRDVKQEDAACVVSRLSRRIDNERRSGFAPVGIRSRALRRA